jgi:flavin-dependent dehydrogenase
MMNGNESDVLIIGAGPAGTVAAALLQREGFRVEIVEKQTFPRFVIGESMLPSSMALLEEAGLLEAVESQGFMRKFGAVFLRGNETCNFDFSNQSAPGWKYTYQVTRAEFDKALADKVEAAGVPIHYGHAVTAVDFREHEARITIETPEHQTRVAATKFVLDCSGYGRVLPRLLDLDQPSSFPPRDAIFTHVVGDRRPVDREEGKIWVCIHPGGGWIWIIPFANGRTSIGVVGDPDFFRAFPEEPQAQLRAIIESDPNAAPRLAGMKLVFPPVRLSGFACSVKQVCGPRFALVGNATEFLDPIFSSGVALALESSRRAVQLLTRQRRGVAVDWEREYAGFVRHGMDTFRAYVAAWYNEDLQHIFFAPQRDPAIMSQICSVLAGYVWDETNPYVTQATRALHLLANIARAQTRA